MHEIKLSIEQSLSILTSNRVSIHVVDQVHKCQNGDSDLLLSGETSLWLHVVSRGHLQKKETRNEA